MQQSHYLIVKMIQYNTIEKKIAKKIKRKRQEKKADCTDESDTSEENDRRHRALRFRKQFKGNTPLCNSLEKSKDEQTKDNNDKEYDNEENISNNE